MKKSLEELAEEAKTRTLEEEVERDKECFAKSIEFNPSMEEREIGSAIFLRKFAVLLGSGGLQVGEGGKDTDGKYRPASENDLPYPDDPIILAVTAGVLQDNYANLLAAGCDDVVWKPIQAETLFSKITEHCVL